MDLGKGSNLPKEDGEYGTKGIFSPLNTPGSRFGESIWYDVESSLLYIFGGLGLVHNAMVYSWLNDLWKFKFTILDSDSLIEGEWVWIGGSSLGDEKAHFGTRGVSSPLNIPGAGRHAAFAQYERFFYLFGGMGYDSSGFQ